MRKAKAARKCLIKCIPIKAATKKKKKKNGADRAHLEEVYGKVSFLDFILNCLVHIFRVSLNKNKNQMPHCRSTHTSGYGKAVFM